MALNTLTVTIPAGKAISTAADCSGSARIVRLIMPNDWTAAPITFCMSTDNQVYHDLYHTPSGAGTGSLAPYEVKVPTVTPNAVVAFPPTTGTVVAWFKIRSGDHATLINQEADRVFQVVVEVLDETTGGGGVGTEGPTGPKGDAGPTGSAGGAGVTGSQGPMGIQGPAGAQGAQGTPGLQGPAGIQGPPGPTGVASTKGVIDGSDAAAGQIGEVISGSNFAGIGLTTNVAMNVTTISLTPGDWTVGGVVIFSPVSTGPNSVIAALSQTAATLPSDNDVATGKGIMQQIWASSMPSGKTQTTPTSLIRVNTTATKSVYLVAFATFGGGSVTVTGYISARRVR